MIPGEEPPGPQDTPTFTASTGAGIQSAPPHVVLETPVAMPQSTPVPAAMPQSTPAPAAVPQSTPAPKRAASLKGVRTCVADLFSIDGLRSLADEIFGFTRKAAVGSRRYCLNLDQYGDFDPSKVSDLSSGTLTEYGIAWDSEGDVPGKVTYSYDISNGYKLSEKTMPVTIRFSGASEEYPIDHPTAAPETVEPEYHPTAAPETVEPEYHPTAAPETVEPDHHPTATPDPIGYPTDHPIAVSTATPEPTKSPTAKPAATKAPANRPTATVAPASSTPDATEVPTTAAASPDTPEPSAAATASPHAGVQQPGGTDPSAVPASDSSEDDQDEEDDDLDLELNYTSLTLYTSGMKTAKLKVDGASDDISWSSSNKKVAKVSSSGKVTAVKKGRAVITAKVDGTSLKCRVTVKDPTITVKKKTITVKKGKKVKISYSLNPRKGKVKFKVKDKKIASVDSKGIVKGKRAGSTRVVISYGNISAKVKIKVK